jgi:hypothetical protein
MKRTRGGKEDQVKPTPLISNKLDFVIETMVLSSHSCALVYVKIV